MKKLIVVVLMLVLLLGIVACKSSDTSDDLVDQYVEEDPYLTLVNKENKLPEDWLDKIELVTTENSLGEEFQVERVTLECFNYLHDELLMEGVDIELDSTYRSVEEQEELWEEWSKEYGEEYCQKYLAVPGYSEHHTGLAIDIFIIKDGRSIRDNEDLIADVEDFAKIHSLLSKYGFILRYPRGKEDITGYDYEPWHLRFVGQPAADIIYSRGITLEEYLEIKEAEKL